MCLYKYNCTYTVYIYCVYADKLFTDCLYIIFKLIFLYKCFINCNSTFSIMNGSLFINFNSQCCDF